ncbi:NAD(P)/FAD-dependent oxidoreductase [Halobacillus sp. Nhm2S1]|uniref:NAD(P)/FAD-dependent oxidoreductase n=1 Tax=Halobacillus sp. Nhm2S1 TaxID=2866716 RepID=UPI001C731FC8|nr:NAD(P)/FAD-dependent oxidoreductase [Halobacillus sp. Nhm2S1]MBX0358527.1 NAD(P)/FAD-dependent oxidoreductase [Halobacillus sp. Nhm2S1]
MDLSYDCVIIGGGIAGLQAGIMLGRYRHRVLMIDSGRGRSSLCHRYNNIVGFPDGVSGRQLRQDGIKQAQSSGAEIMEGKVIDVHSNFIVETEEGKPFPTRSILFATGIEEKFPPIPGIKECLGLSVYVCPDCDGYEITGKKTAVVGNGEAGAQMAVTLKDWSEEIIYFNHGGAPLSLETQGKLREHRVLVQQAKVIEFEHHRGVLEAIHAEGGHRLEIGKAFLAFGGNRIQSDLAVKLGAEANDKGHLLVHPRTKMTNIEGVWAAGDVVDHTQFVTTAMGDGAQAAVWIHKWLKGAR